MTEHDMTVNKQWAFRDCELAIARIEETKAAIVGDHIRLNAARLQCAIDEARDALNSIEAYISRMEERN